MNPVHETSVEATKNGHGNARRPLSDVAGVATEEPAPALMSDRVRALRLNKAQVLTRRPRRKRWLALLLLVLLAGGGLYLYRLKAGRGLLANEMEVDAVAATYQRPLDIVLDATGYVITHSVVKISPRVPGVVAELHVEEGQKVHKGDLLARLDDGQYRADLDQAKAILASAQAQYEEARRGTRREDLRKARAALAQAEAQQELQAKDLVRAKQLQGTISPAEYDRTEAAQLQAKASADQFREALHLLELGPREERLAALAADVENAKALVAKAQFFYDGTRITSPVNGTVLQRSVELGEMLHMETIAGSMCTIADLNTLEAEVDVQERDLAELRTGQPCLITTEAYPDREYRGRVQWFAPVYNRQRGVRRIKIAIVAPDELLSPDMNCRVQVLKSAPPANAGQVVHLPQKAILDAVDAVDGATGKIAFVCDNGVARRRPVQIGTISGGKVEVLKGIQPGDIVLIPGDKALEDGQRVRPRMKQKTKGA
jgi:RND family efflux transporter MFP subunit